MKGAKDAKRGDKIATSPSSSVLQKFQPVVNAGKHDRGCKGFSIPFPHPLSFL